MSEAKVWTAEQREVACKAVWERMPEGEILGEHFRLMVDLQCEVSEARELLKRCSDFSMLPLSLGAAMQEWLKRNTGVQ